jgi:putative peptidoglycan lipid II flippase
VVDRNVKQFLKALGPAVIGSAGVQIAVLADMIIASFLPAGSYSAIYYADRIYQLPVGVIGIAAGTVVLPTMSRLIAGGDPRAAHEAQNRAMGLTIVFALPFVAGFLTMPDLIVSALFGRGAFDQQAAALAAQVLFAYALGLIPVLLIRSASASFFARGDTATPVMASLSALALNVVLKLVLVGPFGAAGLALATAIGAWVNFLLLYGLALKRGWSQPTQTLVTVLVVAFAGAIAFEAVAWLARDPVLALTAGLSRERALVATALIGGLAGVAYAAVAVAVARMLGVRWQSLRQ